MVSSHPSAPEQRVLLETVAALKHDLGKYVAWRSANFDPTAWDGPMTADFLAALQADLLHTRGDTPAWDVWAEHTVGLAEPWPAELQRVGEAVASLRELEAELRAGDIGPIGSARPAIADAQQTIRRELRDLHRRLLAGASEE